jgi:PTS system nitrogen regulatory IIA component
LNVSSEILEEPEAACRPVPSLVQALEAGGVHYRVSGFEKESALGEVVQLLRLPAEVDRKSLVRVLLAREVIASTGIGDGIAIPHVRNPVVLHIDRPANALGFLDQPIEYGRMDGLPVQTLFMILSPTTRAHLHLMSKLMFALRNHEIRLALQNQDSRQASLAKMRRVEASLSLAEPVSGN